MVLEPPRSPLVLKERRDPRPGAREIRFRVEACGVCRTDVRGVGGEGWPSVGRYGTGSVAQPTGPTSNAPNRRARNAFRHLDG